MSGFALKRDIYIRLTRVAVAGYSDRPRALNYLHVTLRGKVDILVRECIPTDAQATSVSSDTRRKRRRSTHRPRR